LQEGGKVLTGGKQVETVVRAPIDGYILEDSIEIGDPVVPLTPYQAGTVLMRMAAMRDLIFRGTVDEIDVGRLKEGMPVTIKIGALPSATVKGRLEKIWLKAHKQEQATVFPIEFFADLRAQKLRTSLTVLGVAWGTVAVVVLLAFGVGLERQTRKRFHGLGDRIVILWGGRTTKPFAGFGDGRPIRLRPDDVPLL